MMFLVKVIDVFVGIVMFLFKGERRNYTSTTPLALGAVGTVGLIVVMLVSVGIPRVWYEFRTDAVVAEMANASGLTSGDPVYVAGVPAGRVEEIVLAGDRVRVEFRLDNRAPLGNQTTATVRLRTVLGKRFLDVMPAGVVDAANANIIPLARTTVPYSLDEVGRTAADTAAGVEQQPLADMMRTLAESLPGDNAELGQTLTGLSVASASFADNTTQVDEVLKISRSLSELLVRQSDSLAATAADAYRILSVLAVRKEALSQIVTNMTAVLDTLSQLYAAKRADFSTLITELTKITTTLKDNAAKIDAIMLKLPPAIRSVVTATGNGNWADVNSPSAVLPDNLLCFLNVMRNCR